MRAATLSIAGIAVLGTGFALGWLMAGSEPRTLVIQETRPPVDAPADTTTYHTGPAPAAPPDAAPRTGPPRAGRDVASVDELLDAIELDPLPSGSGTISVSVHTLDGAPVPDVEVTLLPEAPRPPGGGSWNDPDADPAVLLEAAARRLLWTRRARRTQRTDSVGQAVFEGLGDGRHSVTAKADGWQIHPVDWNAARAARPDTDVEFTAAPVVRIEVAVLNPDGSPAETATIMFKKGNATSGHGWSSGDPFIAIEPGRYEVWARESGRDAVARAAAQPASLVVGETPPPLEFRLVQKPVLSGRVVPPSDFRLQQAVVYLLPLAEGAEPDASVLQASGRQVGVQARQGFHYAFTDVQPGDHVIGVAPGWNQAPVGVRVVRIEDGPTEHDIGMPAPHPDRHLVADVRDAEGHPVEDVQFRFGWRLGRNSRQHGTQGLRHDSGAWWLPVPVFEGADRADAQWTLSVVSPTLGTQEVDLAAPSGSVTVRFTEPAEAVVTVTGLKGSGWEGRVDVALVPWKDGEQRRHPGRQYRNDPATNLDAEGRRTLTGLQPGRHLLQLLAGGRMLRVVAEKAVDLSGGSNALTIVLPPLHTVVVGGAAGRVNLRMNLERDGRRQAWGIANLEAGETGTVTFDGLTEGSYSVHSGRKKPIEFTLPGTSRVDFE